MGVAASVYNSEKLAHEETKGKLSRCKAKLARTEKLLEKEKGKLKAAGKGVPYTECVVCCNSTISIAFVPCGHACVCEKCLLSIKGRSLDADFIDCPICRSTVHHFQTLYFPTNVPRLKRDFTITGRRENGLASSFPLPGRGGGLLLRYA